MGDKNNIKKLRPWRKGDPLAANHLTEAPDTLNAINGVAGASQVNDPLINNQFVRQFKVKSDEGDYLICRFWDGLNEGEDDIEVCKPYLMQRTPFEGLERDGFTYEYFSNFQRTSTNVNDADDSEEQVITPLYIEDDVIYALRGILGGSATKGSDDSILIWVDMNIDGRCYAKDADPPEEAA